MGAAFANAVAANGTDIDDCGIYTGGHPGAQVFPTALALAEELHLSGRELLTATVIGYEVAFRAGRCMNARNTSAEESGYRACGSWGAVAMAAIAARLYGLSSAQTAQALGIAEYHAPDLPLMRDLDHPAMVKHGMGIGPLDGHHGGPACRPGVHGRAEHPRLRRVRGLGRGHRAHVPAADRDPVEAVLLLRLERPDAVRGRAPHAHVLHPRGTRSPASTSSATGTPIGWERGCPRRPRKPSSTWRGRSPAFSCTGRCGQSTSSKTTSPTPRPVRLRGLVELEESPEFTRLLDLSDAGDPAGAEFADLTIELADGRTFTSGPIQGPGYDDWPAEEVESKFRWVVKETLEEASVEELIAMVRGLPESDDVSDFVGALPLPQTAGRGVRRSS